MGTSSLSLLITRSARQLAALRIAVALFLLPLLSGGQPATTTPAKNAWKNKKCAVVLTYDDGLKVHLSHAVPALDSFGLKGTFYLSDYFGGLKDQISGWRKAAAKGHELGNHTIYHPCDGSLPGRSWVNPVYDLSKYTVKRLTDEIRTMNTLLKAIDGKTKRTFAFPCSDTKIRDTAYIEGLKPDFLAARAVRPELPSPGEVNLFDVGCYMINGQSGEEMISMVKKAMDSGSLIVFLFHGVGGEHNLNVSLPAHSQLLRFLKQHSREIWNPTMVELAEYVGARRKANQ